MNYCEKEQDLFQVPQEYYLAHCISADFAMGKGIAVSFNQHFNMKSILQTKYPAYLSEWRRLSRLADCLLEGRVFNLITKERYFHKPTYQSMQQALEIMRRLCRPDQKLAMPLIGCGLDGLDWELVRRQIHNVFADTSVEILVCIRK